MLNNTAKNHSFCGAGLTVALHQHKATRTREGARKWLNRAGWWAGMECKMVPNGPMNSMARTVDVFVSQHRKNLWNR